MATQNLNAENGYTYTDETSGVKYTSTGEAVLNVDDSGVVTGIASGEVTAKSTDTAITATVTLDGTTAFNFTATAATNGLKVKTDDTMSIIYTSGNVTYNADGISLPAGNIGIGFSNDIVSAFVGTMQITVPTGGIELPYATDSIDIDLTNALKVGFVGGSISGTISLTGKVAYDTASEMLTLSKDTNLKIDNLSFAGISPLSVEVTATADSKIDFSGTNIVLQDGAAFSVDGAYHDINGSIAISGGTLTIDGTKLLLGETSFTLSKDATVTITPEIGYPVSFTASDSEPLNITRDGSVLTIQSANANSMTMNLGGMNIPATFVGTISVDTENNKVTIAKGATATFGDITISTSDGDVSFTYDAENSSVTFDDEVALNIAHNGFNGTINLKGTLTFDGNNFTISADDGAALTITQGERTFEFKTNGENEISFSQDESKLTMKVEDESSVSVTYNGNTAEATFVGEISIDSTTNELTLADGSKLSFGQGDYQFIIAPKGDNTISFSNDGEILTVTSEDETSMTVTYNGHTAEATFVGSVSIDQENNEFTLSDGSKLSITQGERTFELKANGDGKVSFSREGDLFTITVEDENPLAITYDGNTAEVTLVGTVAVDIKSNEVTLSKGSKLSFTQGEKTVAFEANGENKVSFSRDGSVITMTVEDETPVTVIYDGHTSEATFVGTISIDHKANEITLAEGSKLSFTQGERTFEIEPNGESKISFSRDGNVITMTAEDETSLTIPAGNNHTAEVTFVGSISVDPDANEITLAEGSKLSFTKNERTFEFEASGENKVSFSRDGDFVTMTVEDETPLIVTYGERTAEATFTGSISIDADANVVRIDDGSKLSFGQGGYNFVIESKGDNTVEFTGDSDFDAITMTTTDTGTIVFTTPAGNVSEFNLKGSISLLPDENKISLAKDTALTVTRGETTVTMVAANDGDGLTYGTDDDGNIFMKFDESLAINVTSGDNSGSISMTGVITFLGGAFSISKGTKMTLTYDEGSTVETEILNDAAGGTIALGANDTFVYTPNDDYGLLSIVVTDPEGNSRSANIVASGTFTIGDTLTLAKDSSIGISFESGRVLTLTATDEVNGAAEFDTVGVIITPDNPENLALSLVVDDELSLTDAHLSYSGSGDGKASVIYNQGVLTLTQDTEINGSLTGQLGDQDYYVRSEDGDSIIDFSEVGSVTYTPGEGATVYTDMFNASAGSITTGKGIFNVTAGSVLNAALNVPQNAGGEPPAGDPPTADPPEGTPESPITLLTAGDYTLNGTKITTTADNVKVHMLSYVRLVIDNDNIDNVQYEGHSFNIADKKTPPELMNSCSHRLRGWGSSVGVSCSRLV